MRQSSPINNSDAESTWTWQDMGEKCTQKHSEKYNVASIEIISSIDSKIL